jgi:hypothetical protein
MQETFPYTSTISAIPAVALPLNLKAASDESYKAHRSLSLPPISPLACAYWASSTFECNPSFSSTRLR